MIRRSSRSEAHGRATSKALGVGAPSLCVGALFAMACAAVVPAESGVASERVPPPRPPGIAIEPVLELPEPKASATPESGLVVLTEPIDTRPARRTVDDFFAAVVREDAEALERLFDRAAHVRTRPHGRAEPALTTWRRRLDRVDYTVLAPEVLYRSPEVEIHVESDGSGADRNLPIAPHGDQVLVRVPILAGNPSHLLGSELVFLLGPSTGGYRIEEMYEDAGLP
jgi:hypothetical protein